MEDHSLLSLPRLSERFVCQLHLYIAIFSESLPPESPISDITANSEEEYVCMPDTRIQGTVHLTTFSTPKLDANLPFAHVGFHVYCIFCFSQV